MSAELKTFPQAIVFTDLDGTLLDHDTYSFDAALPAIATLKSMSIPIVPTTSKTFCEVLHLMTKIGLTGPLIFENGAGIAIPITYLPKRPDNAEEIDGYVIKSFAPPRQKWQRVLDELSTSFKNEFESFYTMSLARISELTGLSNEDSEMAADRQYGEPVKWLSSDTRKAEFIEMLKAAGAEPLIGGRFIHVSATCNKGKAMHWLITEIEKQYNRSGIQSIALGDGNNDIDMLELADIAVRIPSPVNPRPTLERKEGLIDPEGYGPVGWSEAIEDIICELTNEVN